MTALGIQTKQSLNYLLRSPVLEVARKARVTLYNLLVYFIRILSHGSKRELSYHELVEHDSNSPQVYHFVILFPQHHFGGHVMGCSYHCRSSVGLTYAFGRTQRD